VRRPIAVEGAHPLQAEAQRLRVDVELVECGDFAGTVRRLGGERAGEGLVLPENAATPLRRSGADRGELRR
jgi:hypothetical protein